LTLFTVDKANVSQFRTEPTDNVIGIRASLQLHVYSLGIKQRNVD